MIEHIAGDGICLYASLGRSRKLNGNEVRQILLDKSDTHWKEHMGFYIDGSAYNKFRLQTMDKK
eukprot:11535640-Heterocapsa_arctica.AAC.1